MPAVTRIGDADTPHCGGMVRAQGSLDVIVNGIGVSRQGDLNTSHLLPTGPAVCGSHQAPIAVGSTTVFVNGKGIGRIYDTITGCTSVAEGSINVFAGP